MTPEGRTKAICKEVFKRLGIFYFMPPMTIYGKTGVSDFIVLYRGRALFIEAKAKVSSEWTPNQQRFSREVQNHGCPYWLIHAGSVIQLPMLLRDYMTEIDLCYSDSSRPAEKS